MAYSRYRCRFVLTLIVEYVLACQRGDKLVEYKDKTEIPMKRDDIKVPEGWLWKEGMPWSADMNRGVDEEGEYVLT